MPTDRGFIGAGGRTGRFHVERTALLAEIDAELARSGVVTVCGPWGYGRTSLVGDYARMAHARMPSRPVVRVDFESYEAQAFLAGNRAPLMRSLARRARPRAAAGTRDEGEDGGPGPSPRRTRRSTPMGVEDELRALPARYANDVTHLLYECIAVEAPAWCAQFERCPAGCAAAFGDLPLVVVDNLPFLDEATLGGLADALAAWGRAGARLLVVCPPAARIPRSLLPEAFEVNAAMLSVSRRELALWAQDLRFPEGVDVADATRGVPMLVDACRSVRGDPAFDEGFLRASDRVLDHCLGDLMCATAERGRWAMVLLGSGSLADLAAVGAAMRDDELAIVAEAYPLFGIDMLAGTFSCIPVACGRRSAACVRAASGDEGLAVRCIELLLRDGRVKRAGELAALLSEGSRLRLFGRHPDEFADAAASGSVGRSVHSFSLGGEVDGALRPGLARLARLHAYAHDIPERLLPEFVLRATAGTSEGALRAVRSVLGFWRGYAAMPDGGGAAGEGAPQGEAPAAGDVDGIVRALGLEGLRGDGAAYRTRLDALCRAVPVLRGGLASAVYVCHAAVCGFLCDRAETVLALVEPLAGASADPDAAPGSAACASSALLGAVHAVARLMVETPSALRVTGEALGAVRVARAFFEERRIEPAVAFLQLLEAVCLLAGGNERQAAAPLGSCRARWSVQGALAGQLACALALCPVDLAQDEVRQASVRAQTAEALAQRMGVRRAVWLARLFGSVAAVRGGSAADLDRRLLEATLRRSALYPAVSVELEVETALLYAARGDGPAARDILQGVGVFGRPGACRLLVGAVRGLGPSRACVLDLLPRRLRAEYEGLRPSSPLRRCLDAGEPPQGDRGLLAPSREGYGMSVKVLGGLRVSINGHAVGDAEWGRRKARLALLVLALFPETPVPRDSMVEVLWEGSEHTALLRNNLNTILSSLRASLGQKRGGPEYLVTAGGAVGFDLDLVDVDVLRFERLARSILADDDGGSETVDACSALEQMFQAGFGPEFQGMPRFVRNRVEELEELFVQCMLIGSARASDAGDFQVAAWFARAAARVRPQRDDVRAALEEALGALALREGGSAGPAGEGTQDIRDDGAAPQAPAAERRRQGRPRKKVSGRDPADAGGGAAGPAAGAEALPAPQTAAV